MLGASFLPAFQTVLAPQGLAKAAPDLVRWFGAFCKHPVVIKFFGKIKPCSKAMKPQGPGKAVEAAAAKKGDEGDDFDLFGGDDEPAEKVVVKKKKEKKKAIAMSIVFLEVKPLDD